MRVRTTAAAALVTVATIAMTWGALSATAAPRATPDPSATGSSQISFSVPDTASPAPSGPSPTPTSGSTGGSTANGSGGHTGTVGSTEGAGVGGTSSPAPVRSPTEPSKRAGSSAFPGIVWIVAGGGIGLATISILLAILLGWLPNVFALGTAGRISP